MFKCVVYAPVGVERRGSFVVEGCRKQLGVERKENWAAERRREAYLLIRIKNMNKDWRGDRCVCVTWDRPGEGAGSGAEGGPDRGWGALFISPETSALRRRTYWQNLEQREKRQWSFGFCSNVTFMMDLNFSNYNGWHHHLVLSWGLNYKACTHVHTHVWWCHHWLV